MKLLFKQRLFTWFDSYDIYDENGNTVYTVEGQLSWGHCMKVFDANGNEIGMLQEKVFTFLPKFEIYLNGSYAGCISKEFSLFKCKTAHCRRRKQQIIFGASAPADYAVSVLTAVLRRHNRRLSWVCLNNSVLFLKQGHDHEVTAFEH